MGCRCGRLGELGGELAEGQVLTALPDQPEGRRVPEGGRATVAEDHFIAIGQREEFAESAAHTPHGLADGSLTVRRAQQRGSGGGKSVE